MSVDSTQIERTLIGKFMSNPQEYYNNHSLVSSELFDNPLIKYLKCYKLEMMCLK